MHRSALTASVCALLLLMLPGCPDDPADDDDSTALPDPCAEVDCSGNGSCDEETGSCACTEGWFGDDCSHCDPALACGSECCLGGTTCLFGACVTPTGECLDDSECAAGEYCEEALDAGAGATCPPLSRGLCVPLAPACDGPGDPPGCVSDCDRGAGVPSFESTRVKWQWGAAAAPVEYPSSRDVWGTPAVARVHDADCDGVISAFDPPNLAFVSGNAEANNCASLSNGCRKGVLRLLDGPTGVPRWSLERAEQSSVGFAGSSVAVGDVTNDGLPDVVALTGEGKVAVVGGDGLVLALSTETVGGSGSVSFGYGGGLALGDMNNDGWAEIAFGRDVFTMENGNLALLFRGTGGWGGNGQHAVFSHFVDLDGDGALELLAGNTAYEHDGTYLWQAGIGDGFTAVADLGGPPGAEVVHVSNGALRILSAASGALLAGPDVLPGTGHGGPPALADFDGDGLPEIAVAKQGMTSVSEPVFNDSSLDTLWSVANHDTTSSVTGVVAHDFEGDGRAEVVAADECFAWILDGVTGATLFAVPNQSFTGNESPAIADVDGDGHTEVLYVHTGADPNVWTCAHHSGGGDGFPAWSLYEGVHARRGVTVFDDGAGEWSNTHPLWSQHANNPTDRCVEAGGFCGLNEAHGAVPQDAVAHWSSTWSNGFRLAARQEGSRDGPDPALFLQVSCDDPPVLEVQLRNLGAAPLPAGQPIVLVRKTSDDPLTTVVTDRVVHPGRVFRHRYEVEPGQAFPTDLFEARLGDEPGPWLGTCSLGNGDPVQAQAICPD